MKPNWSIADLLELEKEVKNIKLVIKPQSGLDINIATPCHYLVLGAMAGPSSSSGKNRADSSMKPRPRPEIPPASALSIIRTRHERLVLAQLPLLTRHIHIRLPILRRARNLLALQPLHANLVIAPDQVREAALRDVGLRAGGIGDPVHVAAEDAAGPLDERVAEVDDGAIGLRPDVFPGGLVGGVAAGRQDLEPADGAAEEGDGADVGVLEQRGAAVG